MLTITNDFYLVIFSKQVKCDHIKQLMTSSIDYNKRHSLWHLFNRFWVRKEPQLTGSRWILARRNANWWKFENIRQNTTKLIPSSGSHIWYILLYNSINCLKFERKKTDHSECSKEEKHAYVLEVLLTIKIMIVRLNYSYSYSYSIVIVLCGIILHFYDLHGSPRLFSRPPCPWTPGKKPMIFLIVFAIVFLHK